MKFLLGTKSGRERDTRFVELGRYLCEVRARQYWRLDQLKSFDEFLGRSQELLLGFPNLRDDEPRL